MAGSERARTRITAGAWRGRLVDTPSGLAVRPTSALVRQALFDILGATIRDALLVDLYAGAGTIGFEAISRGAARVVAVERDRATATLITTTATRLGCAASVRVVVADAVAWLRRTPTELGTAGVVYLDAPYRDDSVEVALELLGRSPASLVVCEHHRARRLPAHLGHLDAVREARYGTTQLTFYRAQPAGSTPAPREEASPA